MRAIENHDEFTCCICGLPCEGYSNNAWPVQSDGRCCDRCNWGVVLPRRLEMVFGKIPSFRKESA